MDVREAEELLRHHLLTNSIWNSKIGAAESLLARAYLARPEGWAVEAARAEQREADAKLVETMFPTTDGPGWLAVRRDLANYIAAAIRSAPQQTADE